jgi:hypothetical protein
MFVSQEDRTALMWSAMNGHTEVVKTLIKKGANVETKEKVRRRYCIGIGIGANDQRMFGTGRFDLGAIGRKSPMHCSCGFCHGDQRISLSLKELFTLASSLCARLQPGDVCSSRRRTGRP